MSYFSKGAGNVLYRLDNERLLRVRIDKAEEGIDNEEAYYDVLRQLIPHINHVDFVATEDFFNDREASALSNHAQITENLIKDYDLVVELKPKWASTANPLTVGINEPRMKLKCGFDSTRLFSCNRSEQYEEIIHLMTTNSKFLKVFSKGERIEVFNRDDVANALIDVLNDSDVLPKLKYYQIYSDPLDIKHIYPQVERLNVESPSSAIMRQAIEKIPKGSDIPTWESIKHFGESLTLEELAYLYSFSMTLRDVSIFIRLSPDKDIKLVDVDYKPLSRLSKWYKIDCNMHSFHPSGSHR